MSQEMCKEAVNACLPLSKLVPDWFVMIKMLQDLNLGGCKKMKKEIEPFAINEK